VAKYGGGRKKFPLLSALTAKPKRLTVARGATFNPRYTMNLATAFVDSARAHSGKTAVFWGDEEICYDKLLGATFHVAQRLSHDFGVRPGDRVALWMKNCPEFIPAYFGVLCAGGVVVSVNNFLKPDEVKFILDDAGVKIVIRDASLDEPATKLAVLRPETKFLPADNVLNAPAPESALPIPHSTINDLAVLIYTSGTTGKPKGAMLSHGNLLSNVESCRLMLAAVDHDRFVVLLPMFHSFMMTVGVLLPLLIGGAMLLIKSVHPPKNVIAEILQHHATILPAVPQFFRMFAQVPMPQGFPLRLCISGGAPLPAEILNEFTSRMPVPLIEGYGLSEASPVCSLNPIKGPWKAGSIGIPVPGVELSVQDDAGKILDVGETGEICVRGPNVMLGYWNQPEETAHAMRDGWLLTGDVGHRDADGYFFITDRKKDMLLVNGINVYPRQIEEVIYEFPGVKEAAVIGVADSRRGEQPLAFVAPADGASIDAKALQQFLRERLADYKVPKRIVVMPALPRNATGKVLKPELKKIALAEGAQGSGAA
jgi:long-chain acyl-CoA synthetase